MIRLVALAILASTVGSAPATGLAARPHGPVADCPYRFDSDMPSGTFCVYRGVALGSGGENCATDLAVIWSTYGSPSRASIAPWQHASDPGRAVYLGFVGEPDLVLRAVVDARDSERAEMAGYTTARTETPQPLAGEMTLRTLRRDSRGAAGGLSIELREPRQFSPGGCALASYAGRFVGVIRPPRQTTTDVHALIAPPPLNRGERVDARAMSSNAAVGSAPGVRSDTRSRSPSRAHNPKRRYPCFTTPSYSS